MMIGKPEIFIPLILFFLICCSVDHKGEWTANSPTKEPDVFTTKPIEVGAARTDRYMSFLQGKRIGLLVNQSSLIGEHHLVDSLLSLGLNLRKVFAPEHGFRGQADAGERVQDGKDPDTGLPIISLYGKNKKPAPEQLAGLDIMLFDLQDVGVRFYTYTSSLHYLMEACAEQDLPLIVLDRPNPNIAHVAGNIHSLEKKSFVGMHPVPILHGMTIGEYAQMINGEGWLKDGIRCELTVIPCGNYTRQSNYELPVRPSPNLPNQLSVLLYPSLCLFEGTVISVGRGTDKPFQIYGHPDLPYGDHYFTPRPGFGSKYPKLDGEACRGVDLSGLEGYAGGLDLAHLLKAYSAFPDKENFFLENGFFETLCGNGELRKMIEAGKSKVEVEASWERELNEFKQRRNQYLIYARH